LLSQRVWDWFQTTLRTRLEPAAKILVVATRWSETDLAGKIGESDEPWTHLRLPAIAGPDLLNKRLEPETIKRSPEVEALRAKIFKAIEEGHG
jgi:hypothetical protein